MNNKNRTKEIIKSEIDALISVMDNISDDFYALVEEILNLKGKVITIGMGKCSYIAMKLAASLSSTGTSSFFVHPAEASHGDLGMIQHGDLAMILSKSGNTVEILDSIQYCKENNIKIASMNMNPQSILAKNSDYNLIFPHVAESSNVNAPTTSVLMMLLVCDALTVLLHEKRNFSKADFYKFHPGGSIGSKSRSFLN